ncbi:hypothetical protein L6452_21503 [Arctium lappa]|uniref:Uncharacterized protein n=1 Tax=Arctium lappa TaxID=4217 RepID=A0ACB9AWD1_ARCLA|nr:hypothetical protein L6452_21503 [Arctium lappa]
MPSWQCHCQLSSCLYPKVYLLPHKCMGFVYFYFFFFSSFLHYGVYLFNTKKPKLEAWSRLQASKIDLAEIRIAVEFERA